MTVSGKIKTLLLCIIVTLVFSCGSTTYSLIVDEKSPANQNAVIEFENLNDKGWFTVLYWNNVYIRNKLYGGERKIIQTTDKAILTVPSGDTVLVFDVEFDIQNRQQETSEFYSSRNVKLQYNFEPGKRYQVKGRVDKTQRLFSNRVVVELFVELYDISSKERKLEEWRVPQSLF